MLSIFRVLGAGESTVTETQLGQRATIAESGILRGGAKPAAAGSAEGFLVWVAPRDGYGLGWEGV